MTAVYWPRVEGLLAQVEGGAGEFAEVFVALFGDFGLGFGVVVAGVRGVVLEAALHFDLERDRG